MHIHVQLQNNRSDIIMRNSAFSLSCLLFLYFAIFENIESNQNEIHLQLLNQTIPKPTIQFYQANSSDSIQVEYYFNPPIDIHATIYRLSARDNFLNPILDNLDMDLFGMTYYKWDLSHLREGQHYAFALTFLNPSQDTYMMYKLIKNQKTILHNYQYVTRSKTIYQVEVDQQACRIKIYWQGKPVEKKLYAPGANVLTDTPYLTIPVSSSSYEVSLNASGRWKITVDNTDFDNVSSIYRGILRVTTFADARCTNFCSDKHYLVVGKQPGQAQHCKCDERIPALLWSHPTCLITVCNYNNIRDSFELCDNGGRFGCFSGCVMDPGYTCTGNEGSASVCSSTCGDNIKAFNQECDNGNKTGCIGCVKTFGFTCTVSNGFPSVCSNTCGDRIKTSNEQCDNGNQTGCINCIIARGFTCRGQNGQLSICSSTCGDRIKALDQQCDNGHRQGCINCKIAIGFHCEGENGFLSICNRFENQIGFEFLNKTYPHPLIRFYVQQNDRIKLKIEFDRQANFRIEKYKTVYDFEFYFSESLVNSGQNQYSKAIFQQEQLFEIEGHYAYFVFLLNPDQVYLMKYQVIKNGKTISANWEYVSKNIIIYEFEVAEQACKIKVYWTGTGLTVDKKLYAPGVDLLTGVPYYTIPSISTTHQINLNRSGKWRVVMQNTNFQIFSGIQKCQMTITTFKNAKCSNFCTEKNQFVVAKQAGQAQECKCDERIPFLLWQNSTCVISVCNYNNIRESFELCDNGGRLGCISGCVMDSGFTCTGSEGSASVCSSTCGDSLKASNEECDNGNKQGCIGCVVNQGFNCNTKNGIPSVCSKISNQIHFATLNQSLPHQNIQFTGKKGDKVQVIMYFNPQIDIRVSGYRMKIENGLLQPILNFSDGDQFSANSYVKKIDFDEYTNFSIIISYLNSSKMTYMMYMLKKNNYTILNNYQYVTRSKTIYQVEVDQQACRIKIYWQGKPVEKKLYAPGANVLTDTPYLTIPASPSSYEVSLNASGRWKITVDNTDFDNVSSIYRGILRVTTFADARCTNFCSDKHYLVVGKQPGQAQHCKCDERIPALLWSHPTCLITVCNYNNIRDSFELCDNGGRFGCFSGCVMDPGYTCTGNEGSASVCSSTCGDNIKAFNQECDNGNKTGCIGCVKTFGFTCTGSNGFPSVCSNTCGDRIKTSNEQCDNGNQTGCINCIIAIGFTCRGQNGQLSICSSTCGDRIKALDQQCDNGNQTGCIECIIDIGFNCTHRNDGFSFCFSTCGDQVKAADQQCDNGNRTGCMNCFISPDYNCTIINGFPSNCTDNRICGDNIKAQSQNCDNGNQTGCINCVITPGYRCSAVNYQASNCQTVCGDGIKAEDQECDNGGRPGCIGCIINYGYNCTTNINSTSVCQIISSNEIHFQIFNKTLPKPTISVLCQENDGFLLSFDFDIPTDFKIVNYILSQRDNFNSGQYREYQQSYGATKAYNRILPCFSQFYYAIVIQLEQSDQIRLMRWTVGKHGESGIINNYQYVTRSKTIYQVEVDQQACRIKIYWQGKPVEKKLYAPGANVLTDTPYLTIPASSSSYEVSLNASGRWKITVDNTDFDNVSSIYRGILRVTTFADARCTNFCSDKHYLVVGKQPGQAQHCKCDERISYLLWRNSSCVISLCNNNSIREKFQLCDNGGILGCKKGCVFDPGFSYSGENSSPTTICGDKIKSQNEECDNGGKLGCLRQCRIDLGFICLGQNGFSSFCRNVCGDNIKVSNQQCDNGNHTGCIDCFVNPGFSCINIVDGASICRSNCGDNIKASNQQCDNGNRIGCLDCLPDTGYHCISVDGLPSNCTTQCGDGVRAGIQQCDNKRQRGCQSCLIQVNYTCFEDESKFSICKQNICGDSFRSSSQQCDNGNKTGCINCKVSPGYNCSNLIGRNSLCSQNCGDGIKTQTQQCDNKNVTGCQNCRIKVGFICNNTPNSISRCFTICGDGILAGNELCDNRNVTGCTNCRPSSGYSCRGQIGTTSICQAICGDAVKAQNQQCDNGNKEGCSNNCIFDKGYICQGSIGQQSLCSSICGDSIRVKTQICDNGKYIGCLNCNKFDDGYSCVGEIGKKSTCMSICGDGIRVGSQQCDNGNKTGCSKNCLTDFGYVCSGKLGETSVCIPKCGDKYVLGAQQCDNGKREGCSNCRVDPGYECRTILLKSVNRNTSICKKKI